MSKNKKTIAVYGSLRFEEYNYVRFEKVFGKGFDYKYSTVTRGWDLFDLGSYPGIKKSNDPKQPLSIDIIEVSDECFAAIDAMEIGAGYLPVDIMVNNTLVTIYEYQYSATMIVPSGDWSAYLENKRMHMHQQRMFDHIDYMD